MSKALDFKLGLIRPLSGLITSDRPISPLEERHYLYRQESNFEEMARSQADTADFVRQMSEARSEEVSRILSANRSLIEEQRTWREELGYGLDNLNSSIGWLSSQMERQYRMTESGFTNVIKGLGIVNGSVEEANRSITNWLSSILGGIDGMTRILEDVHSKLGDIDTKLANPKKVAALESKRTAFEHFSNGWARESLLELDESLALAPTDFDCHLLKGAILLENPDTASLAIGSFENAKKYSKPYDRSKYLVSCRALAKAAYVDGDFPTAFENQFESMENDPSSVQWLALARYAALSGKYEEFEDAAFRLIALDRFAAVTLSSDVDFTADQRARAVVTEVVAAISRREVHVPRSDVWILAAKQLSSSDDLKNSPFITAMRTGNAELVEGMILNGFPLSRVIAEKGKAPLHVAALWANADFVRLFIHHGADLGVADAWGNTPLYDLLHGCAERKEESVMACLEYLAVPGKEPVFTTSEPSSRMHESYRNVSPSAFAIQRMSGKPETCVKILERLRLAGFQFEWANLYSLVADKDGAEAIVRFLADAGIDPNEETNFRSDSHYRITPKMLVAFKEAGFNPKGKKIVANYRQSPEKIPQIIAYLDEGATMDSKCDGLFQLAFEQRNPELFAKLVRAGGVPWKLERSWFLMSAFWRVDEKHRAVFEPDSAAGMFVIPKLDREVDQYRTHVPLEFFIMAAKWGLNLVDSIDFDKSLYRETYPTKSYRQPVFAEFCYGFKGAFKERSWGEKEYYRKVVDEYAEMFKHLAKAKGFSTEWNMPGRNYVPPSDCLHELFLIASKNREWAVPVPMELLIKAVDVSGYYARRNDENGSWAIRIWKADYDKGAAHLCSKYVATDKEVNSLNLSFFWPGYSISKSQLEKMAKEAKAKKAAANTGGEPKGFWARLFG